MHGVDDLHRGRESYARRAWDDAYESLSRADAAEALGGDDLELLAGSAYMLGHDDEYRGRAALLPAYVSIMVASGDLDAATLACSELEEIAARQGSEMLRALAARARGEAALASGDALAALNALREAWRAWRDLGAPYEAAQARVHLGLACRALGDGDAATLELEAARGVFAQLGAVPDVARVDALAGAPAGELHGLTARELEVLRLLAAGRSNREIAEVLVVSEHTVARHVQNLYRKLRISSRAAATRFAFEHDLV